MTAPSWDGLTAEEQRAKQHNQEQATLPMCADGCTLERDPAEVRAFEARTRGASVDESLSILYDQDP